LWRRRGRREALHDPLDELDDSAHPCVPEEFPVRHDLLGLLDALPPAQRRAIALTRLEGLSVAEASQRCGVSVSALKVQVHRGLKRLTVLARRGS
jgi:RNA polymerase sigma-70 factor, ECF subfamily